MTAKNPPKIKHDLIEKSAELTNILANKDSLSFVERRKSATELINDLLTKTHKSKSETLRLLPPVEVPKTDDNIAAFQSMDGAEPHKHHNFQAH